MRDVSRLVAAVLALCALVRVAAALTVAPMSLAEAVGEAGCIVHGTVIDVQSGRDDGGLPATWVTVRVAEMLKGTPAGELQFKQFGSATILPDGQLPMPFLPRYQTGAEVVLLLRAPSRSGFTSPVDPRLGYYVVGSGAAQDAGTAASRSAAIAADAVGPLLRTLRELVGAAP